MKRKDLLTLVFPRFYRAFVLLLDFAAFKSPPVESSKVFLFPNDSASYKLKAYPKQHQMTAL